MYNPTFLGGLRGAGWPVKVYKHGLQLPQLGFHFKKGKSVFRFSAFQLNQKHRAAVCHPSQSFRNKYNLKFLGGLRGGDWPDKVYELGPKHLFSNHETTWSWISPGLFCFWFQNMYNPTFLGGLEGAGWPVKVYERGLQHPQLCFHFTKGKSVYRFLPFN